MNTKEESANTTDTTETTANITNIHYDCLEQIFDFLNIKSLFNVARTCKRLQIAAAVKFGDKYGKHRIFLDVNRIRIKRRSIFSHQNAIFVNGMKQCLPFLRCFGSKISHLDMHHFGTVANISHVYQYINQHCADTLISVSFSGEQIAWKSHTENFTKPFKLIERVTFSSIILGKQLTTFPIDLFPKLSDLEMQSIHYVHNDSMAVQFPHLKRLSIPIGRNGFVMESARKFLHANPQLRCLVLNTNDFNQKISMSMLLNMISGCRSITILKTSLGCTPTEVITTELLKRFTEEHSSLVELYLPGFKFNVDNANLLSRKLKSLQRFEFDSN